MCGLFSEQTWRRLLKAVGYKIETRAYSAHDELHRIMFTAIKT